MRYKIDFYKEEDYLEVKNLIIASYQWEATVVGVARLEFCKAITPIFNNYEYAWKHTVAVVREAGKVVACVWNEGEYDGSVFFLYDKQERAEDLELMDIMMKFAKTYAAGLKQDGRTRYVNLFIPEWNQTLRDYAVAHGFIAGDWHDECLILPIGKDEFEVELPEGYHIQDGNKTPNFFLSNVHMLSFNYGKECLGTDKGVEAFQKLRQSEDYKKELELCIVDPQGMPVAFTVVWYHDGMAFCELEPLAVVWWERRKGLATAIIHEAANRIKRMYPECTGMRGGDQEFYKRIGFEKRGGDTAFYWEREIFISWDARSRNQNYADEFKEKR